MLYVAQVIGQPKEVSLDIVLASVVPKAETLKRTVSAFDD
jgi:hypothetical protein